MSNGTVLTSEMLFRNLTSANVCCSTGNISWLIAVACIWGVTNVFMKSGVKGLEKIHGSTIFSQIGAELFYLIRNWRV